MKMVMTLLTMGLLVFGVTASADTVTVQNGLNGYTSQTNDILNYGGWNYDFTNNVVYPGTAGYDTWGMGIWSAHDDIDLVSGGYTFPDGKNHHTQRALVRFADLASQIPAGQVVTGAALEVTCWTFHDDGLNRTINIRRALQPWVDGATFWTNYGNGGMDAGYLGDMMYVGSFTPAYGPIQFPLNAAVIQDWVANPANNHGMLLMFPYASGTSHWSAQGQADANPPKLILTTTNAATLNGNVTLQDYVGDVDVLVRVQLIQGGSVIQSVNVVPDSLGNFSIPSIVEGTYDVAIKACSWLQKVVPGVEIVGITALDPVELINGDSDGDNEVTTSDLATILLNMDQVGD